jgi:tRNA(adenine34) deaminase
MGVKSDHETWMKQALVLAQQAQAQGEVPVGAVIVRDDVILGEGFNQPITTHDPSAHAEIVALRAATINSCNYRLPGTTLYVTIEPCTMCVGAMIHARIDKVVFGAREPKAGALVSNLQLHEATIYNHRLKVEEGVLAEECSALMSDFFQGRRNR